ncbi:MAG: HAD hydrolase-like protein [Actinobacteria bacterium]|nr:HAD hydrolase-like protein [Actinomycetota bacterium]
MERESIRVTRSVAVPLAEIELRFSRSSGPGGQHAQKSETRVEALFDVEHSEALTPAQKRRVTAKAGPVLRAIAQDERSQWRNRELAIERVVEHLRAALHIERRRVLVLAMPSIVEDLEGIQLVGEGAEVVLIGGAAEGSETGRIFSYMNLARAFAELDAGAELVCLHKNRWWQTARGPLLDSGAFVAGLEYAAQTEATILGKPSAAFFDAALEALDADAGMTWMVGDDVETDIAGAQRCGLKTVLVRTGKFRPDAVEAGGVRPDGIVSSIAQLPDWLERSA